MTQPILLTTPDEVITALDGTAEVSRRFKVKSHTVSTWKKRGVIPAEYSLLVADALEALDPPRRASPAVFNIAEPKRTVNHNSRLGV